MGGGRWTSAEHLAWLKPRTSSFMKAQVKKTTSKFWDDTHREWAMAFSQRLESFPNIPEDVPLTPEQQTKVEDDRATRKAQIERWFDRESRKARLLLESQKTDTSETPLPILAKSLSQDLDTPEMGRLPQKIEAFQKLFDHVNDAVNEECIKQGAKSRSERLRVRRKVTSSLWEVASDDTKAKVEKYIEDCKLKRDQAKVAAEAALNETAQVARTPEEYQGAIRQLRPVMAKILKDFADLTGWTFWIAMGGPVPDEGGEIFLENIYVGETTEGGCDFATSHSNFDRDVLVPWTQHLNNCYGPDIRQRRARPLPSLGVGSNAVSAARMLLEQSTQKEPTASDVDDQVRQSLYLGQAHTFLGGLGNGVNMRDTPTIDTDSFGDLWDNERRSPMANDISTGGSRPQSPIPEGSAQADDNPLSSSFSSVLDNGYGANTQQPQSPGPLPHRPYTTSTVTPEHVQPETQAVDHPLQPSLTNYPDAEGGPNEPIQMAFRRMGIVEGVEDGSSGELNDLQSLDYTVQVGNPSSTTNDSGDPSSAINNSGVPETMGKKKRKARATKVTVPRVSKRTRTAPPLGPVLVVDPSAAPPPKTRVSDRWKIVIEKPSEKPSTE
ncbi:hypothetical protein CPC08DRAFT_750986 [Agrocybe pediades]|nr:hypothetical protein CPC08DRAFT_750986 [Agrocybe pediades]